MEYPYICDNLGEEFSPSLKDMAMLMSLPLFGESYAIGITLKIEDQEKVEYLTKSISSSKYPSNKVTCLSWVKYFDEDDGRNSYFQLKTFLAYCVSYFVFQTHQKMAFIVMCSSLQCYTIGEIGFPFSALVLSYLYARLDECSHCAFKSIGHYGVVSYFDASVLQMFLQENCEHSPPYMLSSSLSNLRSSSSTG